MADLVARLREAQEKLGKWRGLYAGWWFGTRPNSDPQAGAARDNFDRTIMLRCEVTALTRILLEKGLATQEDLQRAVLEEVQEMDRMLERSWPGFHTSQTGLEMDLLKAAETMRNRGFRP